MANTNPNYWDIEEFPNALRLGNDSIIKNKGKTSLLFKIKVYEKAGKNLILRRSQRHPIRLYTNREITGMLKQAGFSVKYRLARMSLKQNTKNKIIMFVCVKT